MHSISPNLIKNIGNFEISDTVKIPDYEPKNPALTPVDESQSTEEGEFKELDASELEEIDEDIENAEDVETELTEEERIEKIKELSEYITKQDLEQIFYDEIEEIKVISSKNAFKSAYDKAYDETVFKRRGEIQECIQRVDEGLLQMQDFHDKFLNEYALELKYLAVDIAEKMILQKIHEDELILKKLVTKTVVDIKNTAWFDIEVSDQLVNLVEELRKDLERAIPTARIVVSPKAIPIDSCKVNVEEGTIVSSISAQAENLRNIFKKHD